MQQQAIEFMIWLCMTYAGTLIVLPVMELIRKAIKRMKRQASTEKRGKSARTKYGAKRSVMNH